MKGHGWAMYSNVFSLEKNQEMTPHRSSMCATFYYDVEPARAEMDGPRDRRGTKLPKKLKRKRVKTAENIYNLRGANLEAILVLFCFLRDDPPVLVEDLLHPPVPLEDVVVEPDVGRGEGGALDEEGEAVFRIHQSASQFNHVNCLHFLNISLRETKITDGVCMSNSCQKQPEGHTA